MTNSGVTRRGFFGLGLGALATAGMAPGALAEQTAGRDLSAAQAESLLGQLVGNADAYVAAVERGFGFLKQMMDAYAQGSTVRLSQSYSDAALKATGFTYDNAVAIQAWLRAGDAESLERAQILGDALIYAQANNFPIADGRFAQAYYVNIASADGVYVAPAAAPYYFYGSAVGDQAWAGMALAQLFHRTGASRYLKAALAVGNWIVTNTYNTLGPGGYSFGTIINQNNESEPSTNGKSTEHNIDTFAFFTMLATLTKGASASNGKTWTELADHALTFVLAMYSQAGGYFYTGTLGDQISINTSPIPEDVQTWSYLAGQSAAYSQTIDWAVANLQTTDTAKAPDSSLTGAETYRGIVFDTASLTTTAYDPHAVWLEGTSHTVAALISRILSGQETLPAIYRDVVTAVGLIETLGSAQITLGAGQTVGGAPIPVGYGLVASTSVMDTGFGYTYGPSLHIGATGWFLLAALGGNPFRLGGGLL